MAHSGAPAANPMGTHPGPLPGPAATTAGPHKQDLLNKLDPTVDAQSGGTQVLGPGINSTTHGGAPPQHSTHTTGARTAHQPGAGISHGQQHNAHRANDPQFDTTHSQGAFLPGAQATHGGVHADTTTHASQGATNGPHSSKLANTLDPRVESSQDNRTHAPTHGQPLQNQPLHGQPMQQQQPMHGHATHGQQMQEQPMHGHSTNTQQDATNGPHSSRLANTLDPRIDSSQDSGARAPMQGQQLHGQTHGQQIHGQQIHGQQLHGQQTHGQPLQGQHMHDRQMQNQPMQQQQPMHGQTTHTSQEATNGPHSSRIANTLDPRIDSSQNSGPNAPIQGQQTHGQQLHGQQIHGQPIQGQPIQGQHMHGQPMQNQPLQQQQPMHGQTTHTSQEATNGPHSSKLANTLDPRIDSSQNSGSNAPIQDQHAHGHGQPMQGQSIQDQPMHGHQTHDNQTHGATTTTHQGPLVHPGPASKTAGPHKHNILNKLDPGVDSKATVSQQREYRTS